ncbi:MAG: hypothetical protein ISS50_02845 [Anaerolineae bacterium]|nr:hypothetical protein [Anaerolineae bacterium]
MLNKAKALSRLLASGSIPGEGETMAERLGHLLDTDPVFRAEFDRHVKAQLRVQYSQALRDLHAEMHNPDREREVVWQLISKVNTSGLPAPEHIPALIELERTTREVGGTAYVAVEGMIFEALSSVVGRHLCETWAENAVETRVLLSFLEEAFRYERKYDNFAARRRDASLEMAATIAARTGDERALALLHESLSHPTAKIRGVAAVVIYETYEWLGCDMPQELIDRFWQMAEEDRGKKVRQTALAVLQRLGLISFEEVMERLEG